MGVITLTTDFGLKDGNVGVMKGVIWGIAPGVQISDLSHLIGPQNITEAALVVARAIPYFPPGTIHIVVVDPGVGTARRPLAARIGVQYVVGPDNGVFTLVFDRARQRQWEIELIHLDRPQYWQSEVSHVFHGRDIFAPVAAHLAAGVALLELGTPLNDPLRIHLPQARRTEHGWAGEIIHVDHFGNLSTNILQEHLGEASNATIRLSGVNINGMVHTFGEKPAGELIALYGSTGNLIISVVNGSAGERLGAKVGDGVEVDI